jgi:hypothetical protein
MLNRLHSLAGKVDKVAGIGPVDPCRLDAFIPGRLKKLGTRRTEGCWMPARQSRQATLQWRKSTASADAPNCVEIASTGPSVLVRDSRDLSGAVLAFTSAHWSAFLRHVRNGKSDDQG